MRVLVTAACAPPGRNTFLEVAKFVGRDFTFASDTDIRALSFLYNKRKAFLLPAADDRYYLPVLIDKCIQYGINAIIPCIEEEVIAISQAMGMLESNDISVLLPHFNVVQNLVNKRNLYTRAKILKIRTPETYTPNEFLVRYEGIKDLKKDINFIIKPEIAHGMKGFRKVDFSNAILFASSYPAGMIIQECITVERGSIHMVGILCDENSKAVRSFVSKSTETISADGGSATAGVSLKNDFLVGESIRLLENSGWIGPAGIEWLYDQKTDQYFLIDVNPRLWGYSSLMHASNSDFLRAMLMLLEGKDPGLDGGYNTGIEMKRFFCDFFK